MAAVSQDGRVLYHASEEFMSDHEIVMAAVSENGWALQFASEELRSSPEIVMAAVSESWQALRSASQDLRSKPEILARTNFGSEPVAAVLRVALISGRSYTHVVVVKHLGRRGPDKIASVLHDCAFNLGLDLILVVENGTLILSDGTTLDSDSLQHLQPGSLHEATLVIDP